MLIEKIDCVFIWAGDKMIDCRQLGRWNCSAALRITKGLFFSLCSFICVQLHLSFFLYLHPLFISPGSLQYKFLCELMWTLSFSCVPLFLFRNAPQQDPYFKLMRSEQWESTRVYDKGQVLEEYINIKCIALSVVSLCLFCFKRSAVLSAFHSHSTAFSFACTLCERTGCSLPQCVFISASHTQIHTFLCISKCVCGEPNGWLRWNSRIFNCPTLSPLL